MTTTQESSLDVIMYDIVCIVVHQYILAQAEVDMVFVQNDKEEKDDPSVAIIRQG